MATANRSTVALKQCVTALLTDPLAGHDSLENRDGRRTIRAVTFTVKTFPSKFFALSKSFINNRFPQVENSSEEGEKMMSEE